MERIVTTMRRLTKVIEADVLRNAPQDKQVKQLVDDILRRDAPLDQYCQTFPGVLIEYSQ